MEFIEYPVSAVMKLWHMALTAMGVADATAWTASIALLVLTVRLILVPFAYRAYRSTRILVNLRPALSALDEEYKDRLSQPERKELMKKRRELQLSNGYRLRDGCLPALVQIPFFIGLYRILLQVARPTDLEAASHPGIGALSGTDVSHFLEADILGIPLAAYSTMSDEQFAFLGTTGGEVFTFAVPLCITAAVFTTLNMAYSIYRNWLTLDENNGTSRAMFKLLFFMAPVAILVPIVFGLAGPAPAAIMCYWVMNNLWTMTQNIGLHLVLDRQVPYSEEFRRHRAEVGAARKQRRKEIREAEKAFTERSRARSTRIKELDATLHRSSLDSVRAEAAEERDRLTAEEAADREATDRLVKREKLERAERRARQRALQRQAIAEKKAAKAAESTESVETAEAAEAAEVAPPAPGSDAGAPDETEAADATAHSAPRGGRHRLPEPDEDAGLSPYRGRHRLNR
ncbi:membrane protein insertase YidC [Corynebacterium sp.]|uniref:membrane protein insertase YidC n=1 Tax=Corynebacterium sp. TaxID=1720 RepID=UPI0028AC80BA|nr:membrane protein insertase YidC [Corynebacterium sp.]